MAVLNNLSFGDSSLIQFIDDGSIVFRPKHNATVAGIEVAGFLQFDQQAAPAVAPAGSARLYFDTGAQTIQQSIAGGAYALFGALQTSLTNGGGTIAVTAGGAITLTASATGAITITGASSNGTITIATTGAITLTGGGGQTLTLNSTGDITTLPAAGSTSAIKGGGAGTNQFLAGTDGTMTIQSSAGKAINLNGASSSSIVLSTAGAITITPASGQLTTITNFTPGVGTGYWMFPAMPGMASTNVNAQVAVANNVRVLKIYLPTSITITKIAINVTVTSAAQHAAVGLYSTDGNTKIFDSGALLTTSAGTQVTTIASTLIPAGFYFLAFTADSTVPGLEATLVCAAQTTSIYNAVSAQAGTAANASAAGVLPATLGVITQASTPATTASNWPLVLIQ